ncbi:MAG: hypothetical protein QOE28_1730 [Solirubrobacteraceae bacterium]|nr:hypothetical protein [Solirubrobacteraceae bacterium]
MSAPALAFDRRGRGPALVLLHPLGADRGIWAPVAERLEGEREVIAVDLPGFGDSPPLDGDASPAALARAVADGLAAHGIDAFDVAGNSLGGWVALELALAGRARSVVAIAPAGLWPRPLVPKRSMARLAARLALPVAPALMRAGGPRRFALAMSAAHPERVPPAAAVGLIRAYAKAPGFRAVNAAMRATVFSGLDRIRVPVTLAWPEHDRLIARLEHTPPGVRTVVLRDTGHMPMWDDPAQVAEVLLAGSAQRAAAA